MFEVEESYGGEPIGGAVVRLGQELDLGGAMTARSRCLACSSV